MSNEALTRKFVDAYNAEDVEGMNSLMTDDAQVVMPLLKVDRVRWDGSGPAAKMASDRTIEVRRLIASGDAVAIEFLWHAKSLGGPGLAPAGERLEMENCIVLSFRDGLISRYCEYIGRTEGMDLLAVSARLSEKS